MKRKNIIFELTWSQPTKINAKKKGKRISKVAKNLIVVNGNEINANNNNNNNKVKQTANGR